MGCPSLAAFGCPPRFKEGPEVKIFENEEFGFRRITVERPLKLNFQASPERIARLEDEKAWANLVRSKKKDAKAAEVEIGEGRRTQEAVLGVLNALDSAKFYTSRDAFLKDLKQTAKQQDVKLSASRLKAILSALSERDDQAPICTDKHGNPEPNPDLRDYETFR